MSKQKVDLRFIIMAAVLLAADKSSLRCDKQQNNLGQNN